MKPAEATMVSSACAQSGALNMGTFRTTGSVETELEVFHWMPVNIIFCWNLAITGLGMHGCGEQAIEAFLEMGRGQGTKADELTFLGLLSGCSHAGFVSEGKKYFSEMFKVYGMEPMIEHYGCMVDLLGYAELLEEAPHFV